MRPTTDTLEPPDVGAPAAGDIESIVRQRRRIPCATYRLQFHKDFTFDQAAAAVPYLAELGVSDCYASPCLAASPGSRHGYDIGDHTRLNPEIGDGAAYARFTRALADHRMAQLVDFVPNHMSADPKANPWWRDVLTHGPASAYAKFFDVAWYSVKPELRGKVLLPILSDHYGAVLERGELRLIFEAGAFEIRYLDHALPVNPQEIPRILSRDLDALTPNQDSGDEETREFLSILTSLQNLPSTSEPDDARIAQRRSEAEISRERLKRLAGDSARIRSHIHEAVRAINGSPGNPRSFDALHELLDAQVYRLAYWRTALHEINYRRFFDVNGLIGVRMEDPDVFAATHALILRLIRDGKISGLRLDHPDGLFDPARYFESLQDAVLQEWTGSRSSEAAERRGDDPRMAGPFYVVAEKILANDEALPRDWPVFGTTGYGFLNDLSGVFIDGANKEPFERLYSQFIGRRLNFSDVVYESKKLIIATTMAGEVNVLAHQLNALSEKNRRYRDFTLLSLRDALEETVACFPVYRTYASDKGWTASDESAVDEALARARRRNPAMEPSIFAFLRRALMPERGGPDGATYAERLHFAMKFQQYTGPVMAKGCEDTAFYRYNILACLNEVGGDPERFGGPPGDFHAANARRLEERPFEFSATATHDTKRGEDARARLCALSEIPGEWEECIARWAKINAEFRRPVHGRSAPDPNDDYLFYQALLGAWPAGMTAPDEAFVGRVREYMMKAVKEAKTHTSWVTDNPAYDQAVTAFVDGALSGPGARRFLDDFLQLQKKIAAWGITNSLAQVLLKIASPGVPDFYQGTELWDLSFVDPDNRRTVDFAERARLLKEIDRDRAENPAAQVLRLRARCSPAFFEGTYQPIRVEGERGAHALAFMRKLGDTQILTVVPRLIASLTPDAKPPLGWAVWGDTAIVLPPGSRTSWRNEFTGEILTGGRSLKLGEIFLAFPVALLVGETKSG